MSRQHPSASLIAIAASLVAAPAAAQVTAIVPDTAPGRSTSTQLLPAGPGPNGNTFIVYGGQFSGTNLFHSFAEFDLAAGDAAQWASYFPNGAPYNGALVTNIVNRVTGGTASEIGGYLGTGFVGGDDFPNANFYFINPAGIGG